jgi:hypothetical protein
MAEARCSGIVHGALIAPLQLWQLRMDKNLHVQTWEELGRSIQSKVLAQSRIQICTSVEM